MSYFSPLDEKLRNAIPEGLVEKLFEFSNALSEIRPPPEAVVTFHLAEWTCVFKDQRPKKCPTCGKERNE